MSVVRVVNVVSVVRVVSVANVGSVVRVVSAVRVVGVARAVSAARVVGVVHEVRVQGGSAWYWRKVGSVKQVNTISVVGRNLVECSW